MMVRPALRRALHSLARTESVSSPENGFLFRKLRLSFFSDASFVREIIEKPRRRSAFAASPPELALMVPSSIAPSVLKTL